MILTYSHTPIKPRIRRNPRDLRRKCVSEVHSYRDSEGHEYRYEFFVAIGHTLPAPPATLDHGKPLNSQVSGLMSIWS